MYGGIQIIPNLPLRVGEKLRYVNGPFNVKIKLEKLPETLSSTFNDLNRCKLCVSEIGTIGKTTSND